MKFRHSGPLADWMKTVVEVEQTVFGIKDEVGFVYQDAAETETVEARDIKVEPMRPTNG